MNKRTTNYGTHGSDEELVDVLVAISVVSRRLARKLAAASKPSEPQMPQYLYEMERRNRFETVRG